MPRLSALLLAVTCLYGIVTIAPTIAAPQLDVVALFPGKAVIMVDGKRRVLAVGDTTPEGLKLLSANTDRATVLSNGEALELRLDGKIAGAFSHNEPQRLRLAPGANGHYFADGAINGSPVEFMLDTGASVIAINRQTAKKIGLLYRTDGKLGQIETASGLVAAYYLKFREVKLRSLVLRDVDGVVVDGDYPSMALLGQSFLNRLNMRRDGMLLELEAR